MSSEQDRTGSNPLFSIFLLSLYTLGLLPYTLNRLFGQGASEAEVSRSLDVVHCVSAASRELCSRR